MIWLILGGIAVLFLLLLAWQMCRVAAQADRDMGFDPDDDD